MGEHLDDHWLRSVRRQSRFTRPDIREDYLRELGEEGLTRLYMRDQMDTAEFEALLGEVMALAPPGILSLNPQ